MSGDGVPPLPLLDDVPPAPPPVAEDVRAAARRHRARGRAVVIIPARSKAPTMAGWPKRRFSDEDLAKLDPRANLGLLLGAESGGLVDVDLDCPEARALAPALLPPTAMRHGRRSVGETHCWYAVAAPPPKVVRYRDPTATGGDDKACLVELRSGSDASAAQTMIPPSVHPSGERLAWAGNGVDGEPANVEIATLQAAVARLAAAALLARRYPARGSRNDHALALAGVLVGGGLTEEDAYRLVYEVARVGGSDDPGARAAAVRSTAAKIAAGQPVTAGSRLAEIIGDGGAKVVAPVGKWLGLRSEGRQPRERASTGTAAATGTRERAMTCSYLSVLTVVREDRAGVVGGRLAFDEMRRAPTLDGRELRDVDVSAIRARIEERIEAESDSGWLEARVSDVHAAVLQAASERSYHPVRDYLSSLAWDGTARIARVPGAILRADDTPLHRTLLRRWFVSAVARALDPGCKVDTVLVLVGAQGALKSTLFAVLAGDWFTDSAIDVHSKDAFATLQRSWIVEWSELESLRRARDAEAVKAFLSSRVDTYRPPYGRLDVSVKRTSIIVGTTNRPEFLDDETGNRRWWPVRVGATIDLPLLREWRDQLWAEAVALYRAGEQWWLTSDEDAALAPSHEAHATTDAWTDLVLDFAENPARKTLDGMEVKDERAPLTTANVLRYALDKPVGQWSRADENRVGKILTRVGYRKGGERVGGKSGPRVWRRQE